MYKTDSMLYEYINKGQLKTIKVRYGLTFSNKSGRLLKVHNEFYHSIKEQSEVFEYFKKKYEEKVV